jgi:hypothetical protein
MQARAIALDLQPDHGRRRAAEMRAGLRRIGRRRAETHHIGEAEYR